MGKSNIDSESETYWEDLVAQLSAETSKEKRITILHGVRLIGFSDGFEKGQEEGYRQGLHTCGELKNYEEFLNRMAIKHGK